MRPEDLVQRVVRAFAKSDVKPLLESLDDNVIWYAASLRKGPLRFGGVYRGRAGVLEVTSEISMAVTFQRFEPVETISSGGVVWSLLETEVVPKGKLESIHYQTALRMKLRDSRIAECTSFFDTALLRDALSA